MAAIPAKQMLEKLLKIGTLTAKDREVFEGMWDAVHRYGGLSKKQIAWIESAYYKQKFDEPGRVPQKRSSKIGFIIDPSVTSVKRAINMDYFQIHFPEYPKGTPVFKIAEKFFRGGGEIFEIRPSNSPPASSKS